LIRELFAEATLVVPLSLINRVETVPDYLWKSRAAWPQTFPFSSTLPKNPL
jgi:hypothetical protein